MIASIHYHTRQPIRSASRDIVFGSRRQVVILCVSATLLAGCLPVSESTGTLESVWGEKGNRRGQFLKPRAIAIDQQDQLYIIDMTGRVQVFDREGKYLRAWRVPEITNGKPCGLSFNRQQQLCVADTHYYRVLTYDRQGRWLRDKTIGGTCGTGPGEFHFVTDVVQDSAGNYYVAEYGEFDRIQKFNARGEFICQWGSHGSQPGQFERPQSLAIDQQDRLWVADACNHRIQVFDTRPQPPKLVRMWGEPGTQVGQLRYPYGLILDGRGHVYVSEFGNHRVQKFTLDGKSLGTYGGPGRAAGQFAQPWSLALDSQGSLHVLDSYNHRIQRIRL